MEIKKVVTGRFELSAFGKPHFPKSWNAEVPLWNQEWAALNRGRAKHQLEACTPDDLLHACDEQFFRSGMVRFFNSSNFQTKDAVWQALN